jgi:hypothetical protein
LAAEQPLESSAGMHEMMKRLEVQARISQMTSENR